jgi:hypothetical protein
VARASGRPHADTVGELAEIVGLTRSLRAAAGLPAEGYDVVLEADSYGGFLPTATKDPQDWERAGATWWVESWWDLERGDPGERALLERLAAGPPR